MDRFEQAEKDHLDQLAAKADEYKLASKRTHDRKEESRRVIPDVIAPVFRQFSERVLLQRSITAGIGRGPTDKIVELQIEILKLHGKKIGDLLTYEVADDGTLTVHTKMYESESAPVPVSLPLDKQAVEDTVYDFYKQVLDRKLSLDCRDLS